MKVRIPERQKILNPRARGMIRRMVGDCAAQTMAEIWSWGDKRINDIRRDVADMYAEYDTRYPNTRDYVRALLALFAKAEVYSVRPGSGEKVLVGLEHDIVYLSWAYQLRLRGFGEGRLEQFQRGINERIRYYNYTFDGVPEDVVWVMENKLAQRGIRTEV